MPLNNRREPYHKSGALSLSWRKISIGQFTYCFPHTAKLICDLAFSWLIRTMVNDTKSKWNIKVKNNDQGLSLPICSIEFVFLFYKWLHCLKIKSDVKLSLLLFCLSAPVIVFSDPRIILLLVRRPKCTAVATVWRISQSDALTYDGPFYRFYCSYHITASVQNH